MAQFKFNIEGIILHFDNYCNYKRLHSLLSFKELAVENFS